MRSSHVLTVSNQSKTSSIGAGNTLLLSVDAGITEEAIASAVELRGGGCCDNGGKTKGNDGEELHDER
jgi:hypothetical protein